MENPRFDLPGMLSLFYGIANPVTFPGVMEQAQREQPGVSFAGITVVEDNEARPMSHLGLPILYPVTLRGGAYRRFARDGRIEQVTLGELRLPISTVVEMSRGKTIARTPVVASGASVKEVYALEDWQIRLSGILMDEPQQPQGLTTLEAMQEKLLEFASLADSIALGGDHPGGDLFQQRAIDRLSILSLSFNQIPGKPRMHGFQMTCESDDALELILQ